MSIPTYRVSTVLSKPFVMVKQGGGYEGFIVDMLDMVAEKAGFKYNMQIAKDQQYGFQNQSGQWSGIIGEIINRDADIGAADLTISAARERVVDFTKPFLAQSTRLLVNKPAFPETSLWSLLQPFSTEIWFCVIFAMLAVAILFMLIGRFNPYEWRQVAADKDPRGARHSFGLRESLMFVFSTMTLQGYRETPRSLAGRLLAVSWFIFVIITIIAFISGVVTFNINGGGQVMPRVPFDSLDELSRQSEITVGMVKDGSTFRRLSASKIEVYKNIATRAKPSDFALSVDEGVKRVSDSNGRYVFLVDSLLGEHYATSKPCNLMLHGPGLFSYGMGLVTGIGSNLKDRLNMAILSLVEEGQMQMLKRKWWHDKQQCDDDFDDAGKVSDSKPTFWTTQMTLRKLAAPFLILLIGAIFATVALVGEILFKKFRQ